MAERLGAPERKAGAKKKKKGGKGNGATRGLDKKGAETKSQGPAQPSADANAGNRNKIIVSVMRKLDDIEARQEILRGEKTEQMARIKGLGMKSADFAMSRRVYKLEGENRDLLFDTLAEVFGALGLGGQLDFLGAVEKDEERRAEEATKPRATVTKAVSTEATIAKAKEQAQSDCDTGKTAFNPYEDGTPEALAYTAAYNAAQAKIAAKFGEPASRA